MWNQQLVLRTSDAGRPRAHARRVLLLIGKFHTRVIFLGLAFFMGWTPSHLLATDYSFALPPGQSEFFGVPDAWSPYGVPGVNDRALFPYPNNTAIFTGNVATSSAISSADLIRWTPFSGYPTYSPGTLQVTGGDLSVDGGLQVAVGGSTSVGSASLARLFVSGAGTRLTANQLNVGSYSHGLVVFDDSSTGSFPGGIVLGEGAYLATTGVGYLTVAGSFLDDVGAITVGKPGFLGVGAGELTVEGGVIEQSAGVGLAIGSNTGPESNVYVNSNGRLQTGAGGTLVDTHGHLTISSGGSFGTGSLASNSISGNVLLESGTLNVTGSGGLHVSRTFPVFTMDSLQAGSTLNVTNTLDISGTFFGSPASVTLQGGTLSVGNLSGDGEMRLNSGTLRFTQPQSNLLSGPLSRQTGNLTLSSGQNIYLDLATIGAGTHLTLNGGEYESFSTVVRGQLTGLASGARFHQSGIYAGALGVSDGGVVDLTGDLNVNDALGLVDVLAGGAMSLTGGINLGSDGGFGQLFISGNSASPATFTAQGVSTWGGNGGSAGATFANAVVHLGDVALANDANSASSGVVSIDSSTVDVGQLTIGGNAGNAVMSVYNSSQVTQLGSVSKLIVQNVTGMA